MDLKFAMLKLKTLDKKLLMLKNAADKKFPMLKMKMRNNSFKKKWEKRDFTELNSSCLVESSNVAIGDKKCDINEELLSKKSVTWYFWVSN